MGPSRWTSSFSLGNLRYLEDGGVRSEALQFENEMVLSIVQALIGAVTPSMRAIAILTDVVDQRVDLLFAVAGVNNEDAELIDEIVTDISALTDAGVRVVPAVWVGTNWTTDWPGRRGRLIYAAHR